MYRVRESIGRGRRVGDERVCAWRLVSSKGKQGRGKGIASDEESFTLLLVKAELRPSQGRASSRRKLLASGANEYDGFRLALLPPLIRLVEELRKRPEK